MEQAFDMVKEDVKIDEAAVSALQTRSPFPSPPPTSLFSRLLLFNFFCPLFALASTALAYIYIHSKLY